MKSINLEDIRIKIEDKWWSDNRCLLMILKYGYRATGIMVDFWMVAAWYAICKNTHGIPKFIFESIPEWQTVLNYDLAVVCGDGNHVYIRGSKECFTLIIDTSKNNDRTLEGSRRAEKVPKRVQRKVPKNQKMQVPVINDENRQGTLSGAKGTNRVSQGTNRPTFGGVTRG